MASAYHPERARAVITTRWTSGYKPVVVKNIESFTIDSNLDQDSDSFNITIGDPHNQLSALRTRDGEIRIQIFGIGVDADYLLTGIVDDVDQTEGGSISLAGRDRSAIAVDTMAIAGKWKDQRADEFIIKRAKELKLTNKFKFAGQPVLKVIRQDGSENEWEFWYRLIRKEKMWLWMTSDGTLVASKLAGDGVPPTYFFGTPPKSAPAEQRRQYLPVESISYRKTTQGRNGEVQIFYTGDDHKKHEYKDQDPSLKDWEKKPLKYIEDQRVHSLTQAKKTVWEEIHESKVGALEIKITVPDLGFIIRQNRIAKLNIPELDLGGNWFVVGATIMVTPDGFVQEVRLREPGYAVSSRTPPDPADPAPPPGGGSAGGLDETSECLELASIIPKPEWMQFFVNAANEYHGAVPFDLYLATLLGMCLEETNFQNERDVGGPIYFKWEGEPKNGIQTKEEWMNKFKNENPTDAVGPMQLWTPEFKQRADSWDENGPDGKGKIDQYYGNRWLPESNIWEGARVLAGKAGDNITETNLWDAVRAYNGSGPVAQQYMIDVKNDVYVSPGYLKLVQKALQACKEEEEEDLGGDGEVPDNNARQAAEALLDANKKGWFRLNSYTKSDLEATRDGKSIATACGDRYAIKAAPLNLMLYILESGYSSGCSSLISGHSCNTRESGSRSRHTTGEAADISDIGKDKIDTGNNTTIGNGSQWTRSMIIEVMKLINELDISGGKPKQMICSGNGNYDCVIDVLQINGYAKCDRCPCYGNGETRQDHKDHIHIGF